MSRVIVIYDSNTGLTESMAQAVAKGVREVSGIKVELLKVGKPFSISKLDEADAIIFGSPTIYGGVTSNMKTFLESVKELRKTKKLNLSGKIGAVFGSYAWDGGWLTDGLEEEIKALGFKVVTPGISVVDRMGAMGIRIDEDSLKRCQELGKNVAIEFAV